MSLRAVRTHAWHFFHPDRALDRERLALVALAVLLGPLAVRGAWFLVVEIAFPSVVWFVQDGVHRISGRSLFRGLVPAGAVVARLLYVALDGLPLLAPSSPAPAPPPRPRPTPDVRESMWDDWVDGPRR